MYVNDIEALARSSGRLTSQKLWQQAWHTLNFGRRFLDTVNEEIDLLREAILADGGRRSVWQLRGVVSIERPIIRRKEDEDSNRYATMTVHHDAWRMNHEQLVEYALKRLDDLRADN